MYLILKKFLISFLKNKRGIHKSLFGIAQQLKIFKSFGHDG